MDEVEDKVTVEFDKADYTGKEIKPTVTIEGLKEGTDFEVSYTDNVELGVGHVIIKGIGKYEGTLNKPFKIVASDKANVVVKPSAPSTKADDFDKDSIKKDVLTDEEKAQVVDRVQTGAILVDGLGVGDVGNIVLRDRQHLAEDGILIVVLTLEKYSNQVLAGPDIVSRGFVYVRESEGLMDEAKHVVEEAIEDCMDRRVTDWGRLKTAIRDSLSEFLWKRTKRSPMILPIIMEV